MTSNKNLGNAGEFYVLAQLAQRGYIAGKTDDGQTLIDVIATDPESLNTVNIQVKTRTIDGKISSWLMSEKNEKVFEYLLIVVLDDDYDVLSVLQLTWDDFMEHKKYNSRMENYNISLTKKLISSVEIIYQK